MKERERVMEREGEGEIRASEGRKFNRQGKRQTDRQTVEEKATRRGERNSKLSGK